MYATLKVSLKWPNSFTFGQIVEDVAKIFTNKLSTFDFFNFYFTTCFNPKQGPLQVSLHLELTETITQQNN